MKTSKKIGRFVTGSILTLLVGASFGLTGCSVYSNGMNLPNPYYMHDRVEYHPRGPEFPFPNEAANLQQSMPER